MCDDHVRVRDRSPGLAEERPGSLHRLDQYEGIAEWADVVVGMILVCGSSCQAVPGLMLTLDNLIVKGVGWLSRFSKPWVNPSQVGAFGDRKQPCPDHA